MTETYISSALQIPTFWAANTAARDKLWRREGGKTPEEMWGSSWRMEQRDAEGRTGMVGGLLRISVSVPKMGWFRPWGDGAGLWKLNSALGSSSAWAWVSWPKSPEDLCPGSGLPARTQAPHQWQGSCQGNSVFQYCSSRSSVPPQNIEIKKSWEDPVLYHDYLLKLKSCGSSLTDLSR